MNSVKFLHDSQKKTNRDEADINPFKGKHAGDTEIIFRKLGTNEELGRVHNKIVIAGSQFTAMKHFNMPALIDLPSYNTDLNLDNTITGGTPANIPKICLFACGIGGCGTENSQVYEPKYTGRISPSMPNIEIVPFRYQLPQNDLSADLRQKYFGRKTTSDRVAYYFKAFETAPEFHSRFVDGTVIDNTVYSSSNNNDAEFYCELSFRITKDDFRDYFRTVTGINDARINQISLITGWYSESDGYKWYQDTQPMTLLNIPNEPLIDPTKGIDIIYHIYY